MYKQKTLAKAVAITALVSGFAAPTFAGGDSELLERIELLEQQLRDLKKQVSNQNQQHSVIIEDLNVQKSTTSSLQASVDKVAGFDVKASLRIASCALCPWSLAYCILCVTQRAEELTLGTRPPVCGSTGQSTSACPNEPTALQ